MAAPGSGDGSNELRLKPRDSPIIVGRFTSCLSLPSLRLHPSGAGDDRDGCWRLLMLLDCSSTVEWGTTTYRNCAAIMDLRSSMGKGETQWKVWKQGSAERTSTRRRRFGRWLSRAS